MTLSPELSRLSNLDLAGTTRLVLLWGMLAIAVLALCGSGAAQITTCSLVDVYPNDPVYKVEHVIRCVGPLYDPNTVCTTTGTTTTGCYTVWVPSDAAGSLAKWNGTLLLWNHGAAPVRAAAYRPEFVSANGTGRATYSYLLSNGYAFAGSTFLGGWTVEDAFKDQITLLGIFPNLACPEGAVPACTIQSFGTKPSRRTIASGGSLGGLTAAGLVQNHPEYFDGALLPVGPLAGGVGLWNTALDLAFAFKTLLVPPESSLQLVHISDPESCPITDPISDPSPFINLATALTFLNSAQETAAGRARIALAAALSDIPGWFDPLSPEPADYDTQEANQYSWLASTDFPALFVGRADLECHAGGNPSWNTGVDYRNQLEMSADYEEVKALYVEAGLNLDEDLQTLAAAQRISADQNTNCKVGVVGPGCAVEYLRQFISFNGEIQVPVLALHGTDDGLVAVENEQAYKQVVAQAGNNGLLRQVFVHRAGHGPFTPAEQIATLQALIHRLDTGKWQGIGPEDLNDAASELGSALNPLAPAFVDFDPAPFLRPFSFYDVYPGN